MGKFIKSIREYIFESKLSGLKLIHNYKFDNKNLKELISNARKMSEDDFVEDYVYLNDITIYWGGGYFSRPINKGDTVTLSRNVRDKSGKIIHGKYGYYKEVVADKDYNDNHWEFILDNTTELKEEGKRIYHLNKDNKKPEFNPDGSETIIGYHASPRKFDQFRYGEHSQSGQIGSDYGLFFFKELGNAEYYSSSIDGVSYIYKCEIRLGKYEVWKGEDVGTNWGRSSSLEQADIEGFDVIIIEDADTGYGITDEIIVFNDDNIKILEVEKGR